MDQHKYRVLTGMGVSHDYAVALAGGNAKLEAAELDPVTQVLHEINDPDSQIRQILNNLYEPKTP